jgi:hypothetical protein
LVLTTLPTNHAATDAKNSLPTMFMRSSLRGTCVLALWWGGAFIASISMR